MSIGVAIPCYEPHHKYLSALLDSIANQTHRPDRVVISCSSWAYDGRVDTFYKGIPLTILYWSRLVVQAENRNLAASELQTDYITFFDADDLMHPRRIEFVLKAFEQTKCQAIVHNYQHVQRPLVVPFEDTDELIISEKEVVKDPNAIGVCVEGLPLHHAHISITKQIFDQYKFDQNPYMYRIEDSLYAATLVKYGIPIRYIANKLSQFMY